MRALLAGAQGESDGSPTRSSVRSRATLKSNSLDPAFKGEAILLPSESSSPTGCKSSTPTRSTGRAKRCGRRSAAPLATRCSPRTAATARPATICRPHAKGTRRLRTVSLGLIAAAR